MGHSNNFSPAEIHSMLEFVASKKSRGKDELRSDACATDHGHQAAKDAQKLIDEHGRVFERGEASLADLSREEELLILDTDEDSFPYTQTEWDVVAVQYNSGRTLEMLSRSAAELIRAHQKLTAVKKPNGDPDCPETVRRAKHLRRNIEARRDAENLDGGVERESDSDENERDSDRVEGSDNNPNDKSSQSNESDTVESSNRRCDCRNASQDISDIVSMPGDEEDAFATNSAIPTITTATTTTTATAKKGKLVSRAGTKRKADGYIPARQASLRYPAVGGDDNPADRRLLNMSKVMDYLKKKTEVPKSTSEASQTLATQMQADRELRREEAERRETLQYLREEREGNWRWRGKRGRTEGGNRTRRERRSDDRNLKTEKRRQECKENEEREDRRERERRDEEGRERAEDRRAMMQMFGMVIHRSMNNTGAP
ncbi:hypothetical protein PsorP6_000961 [Peronosclerospora sorghi]|uniref:Uncharacterized protein n=1 Tax=Peronosclerospora sorghi TaxID=230839 RepID=A0ACC0WRG9_9STRA|nr:hypothetical protein PsorP6_000961 [Peronosclerospora sorghi]